ncbi:hypothetical protein AB1Y20_010515 [Prymnesium parvum]|uniref:BING4 C-terminal domain-containing protein n=1 Tax=Prymnesium parvum TaxID=97485 RepID=A0AB34IPZ1_PRYPA
MAGSKAGGVNSSKLVSAVTGAKTTPMEKKRLQRYSRGDGNKSKGVTKHRLKLTIKRGEKKIRMAEVQAAQAERLLPTEAGELRAEGEMESTARFSQQQIAAAVDLQSQAKAYNMKLEKLGPYRASYSADGQHLLLGGRKGHVAVVKWSAGGRIQHQIQLRETVRDLCFLRDHTMFAVAQHKYLYLYDGTGTELHCLRNHKPDVSRLAFLRYHWLLATVGSAGRLRYLDVSMGTNVADIPTRLGPCDCLALNSWNGVVALGHDSGVVTMWTPNLHEPVVKMLCHKGALNDLAIDRGGRYMASAGRDGALKVWDIRMFKPLHSYRTPRPVASLDISDRGMLACVAGPTVQVYRDGLAHRANGPYMSHLIPACLGETVRFCPYEDVLGVGHSKGFCSMLVPGAGEPNFDTFEVNPFEGLKQRREATVVSLLEKLPPATIMLEPTKVNTVDVNQKERQREMAAAREARLAELRAGKKVKKKTKGRSKASARAAKKESNIMDEKRAKRMEQLEAERAKKRKAETPAKATGALDRFNKPTQVHHSR